jgi:hypothetical protein
LSSIVGIIQKLDRSYISHPVILNGLVTRCPVPAKKDHLNFILVQYSDLCFVNSDSASVMIIKVQYSRNLKTKLRTVEIRIQDIQIPETFKYGAFWVHYSTVISAAESPLSCLCSLDAAALLWRVAYRYWPMIHHRRVLCRETYVRVYLLPHAER